MNIDFSVFKNRLRDYLSSKGIDVKTHGNVKCFSGSHADNNPSLKINDDSFCCFSCGFHGDLYDAVQLFEGISGKVEQYRFAEKFFTGTNAIQFESKPKFEIDIEAYNKVYEFVKEQRNTDKGKSYLKFFAKKRGYENTIFSEYLGFWTGYQEALKTLDYETLKNAGIPVITEEKKYSSWNYPGVVFKFQNGFKLMYIGRDKESGQEKTRKYGSHGSRTFPYPNLPEGKRIVLVEAEISALAGRINNIPEFTATGGTQGLTQESCKMLHAYEEIIFCFDGDEAGLKSAGVMPFKETDKNKTSAVEKLIKSGYQGIIKIVILPQDKDPDDLIRDEQISILKECLNNAKNYDEIKNSIIKKEENSSLNENQGMPEILPEPENLESSPESSSNDLETKTEQLPIIFNAELMEKSFFSENGLKAESMRQDINFTKAFIYEREDLANQEAARLYFEKVHKFGLKLQSNSISDMIWIYEEQKKRWTPKTDGLNSDPLELFIKKYGASWTAEGSKKPFKFRKNNNIRSEIDKHFNDYVKVLIKPESDPFSNNKIKKMISCKNGVLDWNKELKKFELKEHSASHNLTVEPFSYNRLDMNNLTDKQKILLKNIKKYFISLVKWIEYDNKEIQNTERLKMINFLLAYIGYTLTPWREKCFHVWIGEPDSGKSTLKEILKLLHGDKFCEVRLNRWSNGTNAHDYEILPGKLVIADDDFIVGARLPEQELKTLAQNGTITINPKHKTQFTITNMSTPLILTNGMPRAEDITIENRLYAVPFRSNFSRKMRGIETEEFINGIKEHESLEILFNLAIDISEDSIFKYGHFDEFTPLQVKEASTQIINSASSVLMWLDDMKARDQLVIDPNSMIKRTDLYSLYQSTTTGIKKGIHAFYEAIKQRFAYRRRADGEFFIGIGKVEYNKDYKNPYEKEDLISQPDLKYEDEE